MFSHILIPVAPAQTQNCPEALKAAKRLLKDGGKVSALSVIEEIPTFVDTYVVPDYPDTQINEAKKALEEAFAGEAVEIHITKGHSARAILDWAEQNDADCIVVSSHRPGFSDFFIGSTAAKIVRHAQTAVVVLR